ncbi:prenyltransferase [Chloroflexota bacterium]
MKLKIWFQETRPSFLLLPVVLAFLGTSIAWYDGFLNIGYAVLAFVGMLFGHISVNVLNEYFDYKAGIDFETVKTPFSGGSGILPAALLKPKQVLWFGIISFLIALPIGVYFVIAAGWLLLPVLVIGAICILFYSPVITRLGWPEWAPGLGLGMLPILGFYYVQTSAYTWPVVIAAVPSGILVYNLLLLNEFPDAAADRKGGKKTLPIIAGLPATGRVYSVLTMIVYLWIMGGVIAGVLPPFASLALLTLPFAVKAMKGALNYKEMIIPAMANNVLVVLATQFLLGVGYILSRLVVIPCLLT